MVSFHNTLPQCILYIDHTSTLLSFCYLQVTHVNSFRQRGFRYVQQFLQEQGIAVSRTTPYNHQGNGQSERNNGIIGKTAQLAAADKGEALENWEQLLPVALHAIRTLLCTASNATPHERFLPFPRSSTGVSLSSWLSKPEVILLKRNT